MAPKGKGAPATGGGGRGTGGGGVGRGGARAGAGKKAKSLGLTGRPPDKTEQTTTLATLLGKRQKTSGAAG